jgi:hypothetical protein
MVFKEDTHHAEMMYSYCAKAIAFDRSLCKIKSNLLNKTFDWKSVLPKSSLGIKDDFLSECFRTGVWD